ncbi:MAG: carboxypeptidase regulatory-like domain-containing protein [Candidatus Sulfotelmatobacter sp.]
MNLPQHPCGTENFACGDSHPRLSGRAKLASIASMRRAARVCPARRPKAAVTTWPLLLCVLLLSAFASAQTLTGSVKNATTNKPAAGDDVVLITLGQGMEEAGRTKTDAKGNFSFKLGDQGPHLIRVIHQNVTYHRMAPPGTTSVDVDVYDASKKVEGIEVVADIMRFQSGQGQMQVERTFAVQNNSKPPRTQMNEHNLEFYVPEGATITEGDAMTAGGQPLKSAPVPEGGNAKNKYAFLFPLRPGETRFSVVYTLPYTGSINIDPKSAYPLEHFVAIAPKSMEFSPANASMYKVAPFPGQPDANVEVASNTGIGQAMMFKLSGEGTLQSPADDNGQSGGGSPSAQAQNDNRPGGGLGPPIDAPDPLQKYRWYILGGFAAVLIIGGVFVASRQQAANRAARATAGLSAMEELEDFEVPAAPKRSSRPVTTRTVADEDRPASRTSMLLEGLKDELFELEVEHKQGRISQQEYDKTKAALDQTLQRALRREAQKT